MGTMTRSWRRGLLPLLASLVLAGATVGLSLAAPTEASWSGPIELSTPPGPSWYPQLALDPQGGNLFAIWIDKGAGGREEILGRRWDRASATWTAIENLSKSAWEDRSPLLFFDSRGQGLLIWTRRYAVGHGAPADGTDLVWRAWDGTGWSAEQVLLHRDFFLPGAYGLIPVETPDATLLFITWDSSYRTTEYRAGSWSEPSPWENLGLQYPTVNPVLTQLLWNAHSPFGNGGLLHAAAFGKNSSQGGYDAYYYDAYYLTYDGSQWGTPLNLSARDGVARSLGMAFDGQGRLHFLWSDPDYPYSSESERSAIWERVYDGGAWSSANSEVTAYNEAQSITDFSLTADANGILHLAWSEGIISGGGQGDPQIYYQTGDGTAWGPEEKVYALMAESRYPSLVVGDDGAAVAWQEGEAARSKVFFSRQVSEPLYWTYLPLVNK